VLADYPAANGDSGAPVFYFLRWPELVIVGINVGVEPDSGFNV